MKKVNNVFSSKIFFALIVTLIQVFLWVGLIFIVNLFFVEVGVEPINVYFWLFMTSAALGVLVSIRILMSSDHQSYKIVWLLFIMIVPTIGIFCYFFFGRHKIKRKFRQNFIASQEEIQHVIDNSRYGEDLLLSGSREDSSVSKMLVNAGYPVYQNTQSKYFGEIETLWEELLDDLAGATKFIYIEMYIIRDGEFWDSVKKILVEKSLAGVDVRITSDDFGTTFSTADAKKFEKAGIKTFSFNRIGITFDASKNNRTHRKMIIVDGNIAYTGGFNIADEYVNLEAPFGRWKDCGIRLEGPAVHSFTILFLSFWQLQAGVKSIEKRFSFEPSAAYAHPEAYGTVQPISSGPLKNERLIELTFMQMINSAKKSVYLTTPYLMLDPEIETCICNATKSGVDVRIIMPGVPDKKSVFEISRSFYPNLIKAGVKIFEYAEGFVHAKQLIVDGTTAFIGTCNMDFRSFFLHFECGVILYDADCITQILEDYFALMQKCRKISPDWAKNLRWWQRLWRSFARLFAPLL